VNKLNGFRTNAIIAIK